MSPRLLASLSEPPGNSCVTHIYVPLPMQNPYPAPHPCPSPHAPDPSCLPAPPPPVLRLRVTVPCHSSMGGAQNYVLCAECPLVCLSVRLPHPIYYARLFRGQGLTQSSQAFCFLSGEVLNLLLLDEEREGLAQ